MQILKLLHSLRLKLLHSLRSSSLFNLSQIPNHPACCSYTIAYFDLTQWQESSIFKINNFSFVFVPHTFLNANHIQNIDLYNQYFLCKHVYLPTESIFWCMLITNTYIVKNKIKSVALAYYKEQFLKMRGFTFLKKYICFAQILPSLSSTNELLLYYC